MGDWERYVEEELRIGFRDKDLGLKFVYRLRITFKLWVYLIGCGDAE